MAGTRTTWELVGELDEEVSKEGRVVVDVEAPLRPFGSMPTPPKGVPVMTDALMQKGRAMSPLLHNPALDEVTDEALVALQSLDISIDTASASGEGEAL